MRLCSGNAGEAARWSSGRHSRTYRGGVALYMCIRTYRLSRSLQWHCRVSWGTAKDWVIKRSWCSEDAARYCVEELSRKGPCAAKSATTALAEWPRRDRKT